MELDNVIAKGKGGEDVEGRGPRMEHGTANLTIFLSFSSLSNNIPVTLSGNCFILRHGTCRKDGQIVAVNYIFNVRMGLRYTRRDSYMDQTLASSSTGTPPCIPLPHHICNAHAGTYTDVYPSSSVFPCQYSSVIAQLPTLCNLSYVQLI